MSIAGALLLIGILIVALIIGLMLYREVKPATDAEQFMQSYVKREIYKAQHGAANAEQWAVDLVNKTERFFK